MPSAEVDVLIVGAGIGGLAAAVAVRQAGLSVRVFERASDARELGFALLLAPNAMTALRRLGLADEVRRAGVVLTSGEMRRPNGDVLRRFDLAAVSLALGEDSVCLLRPALHGALLRALGPEALELSARATRFVSDGAGVTLHGESAVLGRGRLLIGADGIGSAVRRQLRPGEPEPRRSGLTAIRGVARGGVQHLGDVSGAQYFGRGLEAGASRATPTDVYWFVAASAPQPTAHELAPRSLLAPLLPAFHEPFRALVASTPDADLRADELRQRDPLASWGDGPATLLGDAAHPMLPHAGQGAAQALEDAVALGLALRSEGATPNALRRYERLRAARAHAIVALARRNARLGSIQSPLGCWLRDLVIRHIPERRLLASLIDMGKAPQASD